MGKFSKIFHHIESKDVKNKYEQKKVAKIQEEKEKKEFKKYLDSTMETKRYNWREGMTTSDIATLSIERSDDPVASLDASIEASFQPADNYIFVGDTTGQDAFDGTRIRTSGSGTGNSGGFNVGGNYLAFDQAGNSGGASGLRHAILAPIDASEIDTITITAIVGDGTNGGSAPNNPNQVGNEALHVLYHHTDMRFHQAIGFLPPTPGQPDDARPEGFSLAQSLVAGDIIPVGASKGSGLHQYSLAIPEYARSKATQFSLNMQASGEFDNIGITEIKFERKAPMNVIVSLDDPRASSFIRGAEQGSTPKKRKKSVDDQLAASDQYTKAKFGNEFPGQEVRVGGEDPFKGAEIGDDVEPSPQSKDEVKKSFSNFDSKSKDSVERQNTTEVEKLSSELDSLDNNPNATLDDYTSEENVTRIERILELDPNNVKALHTRAFISGVNGDYDAAIEDAERAYEIAPNDPYSKPTLEYAYVEKIESTWGASETMNDLINDTELMNTLDKAIELNPDDNMNRWYRSTINEANGDLDATIKDLEKLIELNPEDADSELRLSQVKQAQAEKIRQEQEVEAERLEKEAREIEEKAYKDYYEDPNWNIESEIEPVEVSSWDKNNTSNNISDLYKADYETAKATIENLPKQSETIGATYNGDNIDYVHLSQINKNIENRDVRFRSPESMSQKELQRTLISLSLEIEDQKYWINDLSKKLKINVLGAPNFAVGDTKFTGEINGTTAEDIEVEDSKLQDMLRSRKGNWKAQNEKVNKLLYQRIADREIKKLNAEQYQLITQYNKLYDAFMGVEDDSTSLNLPDTIQKVLDETEKFDLNDEERKSIEALMDLPELKSSEDFAKVIGSNLVDPDAIKSPSYFKLGGGMLNYAVPIALSEILNQPILVDDSKIPDKHRNAMRDALQENILSGGKLPTWFALNATPEVYVDENIRVNPETGKVESNYKNPNLPPGNQPGQIQHIDNLKSKPNVSQPSYDASKFNPIMGQGGAQYQFVVPEDGSAPYMLYVDHAYNNKNSPDVSEIPGSEPFATTYSSYWGNNALTRWMDKNINLNKALADGVTAIGDFIHRGEEVDDGTGRGTYRRGNTNAENIHGMAGYPPNIRGDLITRVKIPLSNFSKEVQDIVLGKSTSTTKTNEPKPKVDEPKPKVDEPKPEVDLGSAGEIGGVDATSAATVAATTAKKKRKKVNESNLYERLKKKPFFNPDDIKPIFPENPPPKLDPKTGMHPQYGKKANRFKKLDPISANSMPPTGDPEIDAVVNKQKTVNKIKKMARNK